MVEYGFSYSVMPIFLTWSIVNNYKYDWMSVLFY